MHPIKRIFLIGLFAFGTVAGFGHGFAHLGWCASSCHANRRAAFEDRVADVCTRSAERVWEQHGAMNAARGAAPAPAPGTSFTIAGPATLTLGAPAAPAALAPAMAPAAPVAEATPAPADVALAPAAP